MLARQDSAEIAEMLAGVLEKETDTLVRRHAVDGLLGQSAGVDPAAHLRWLSTDFPERVRHHRLIGQRGDTATILAAIDLVESADDLVEYAFALSQRVIDPEDGGWEDIGETVSGIATRHLDAPHREAACEVLGAVALPGSAEALARVLADAEPTVRAAAVTAIGARELTEQADTLVAMLSQSRPGDLLFTSLLSTLVALNTPASIEAVAAVLAGSVSREQDAVVLAALERSAGLAVVRAHTKALVVADPVDCPRAAGALMSLVRAGDGTTDDVVADLTAVCPEVDWLAELFAVWAADPLLAVQIRPFRDHPSREVRMAAEVAWARRSDGRH